MQEAPPFSNGGAFMRKSPQADSSIFGPGEYRGELKDDNAFRQIADGIAQFFSGFFVRFQLRL